MSKKRSRPDTRRAHLEELERRILLSADLESALVDPSLADGVDPNDPAVQAELLQQEEAGTHDAAVVRRELVLVDAGVEDYEALLADLQSANSQARQLEVVLLDGERDGIQQISEILEAREDLDAIHIVSHGTEGAVQLGSTWLTRENLDAYQSAMAGWGDALSEKADLLFYGCDLAGGASGAAFAEALSGLTGADVAASTDATGSAILGGDWDLEYQAGVVETSVALGGDSPASFQGTLDGTAIWHQDGVVAPIASPWDGASFGGAEKTVDLDEWRIVQGAEAPTRDEKIVVGVSDGGTIDGMMWNGSAWSALPINSLGKATESYWWGFDVAYESQSGDAVLVWNDNSQAVGEKLRFSVWDGTAWSTPASITGYGGAEPQQIKIASNPRTDEMVLVVSDSNADDYALEWNGWSWSSAVPLDASGTGEDDQSGISVAYEAQSGHAMVVYGKDGDPDAYYRIWNGSSWEGEQSIAAPSGVTSQATWTALGSDPTTDRLVLGVLTSGGTGADVWLNVWDGSSWEASTLAEKDATGSTFPNLAVAFEGQSGHALAVSGQNGASTVLYHTWTEASGWSVQQIGPDLGATPNSMTLDPDPTSNRIMLSVQDSDSDLNYVLWDGGAWGTPSELEADTGEVKNQPFLFLWDQEAVNDAPVNTVPGAQATPQDTSLAFSSAGGNAISISDVDAGSNEVKVTLGVTNGTLTLNLNAAPQAGETRVNATTTNTQSSADIDYAADGSFVVVWQSDHASSGNYEVYAQRLDSSGAAVGAEILVNTTTANEQSSPKVGVADDGSFVVVWQCDSHGDDKNNSLGIVAQRFDSNGGKLGGEFLVNTTTNGDQQSASVAVDAGGNFVVVWSGSGSGDSDGVFFQRYNASGVAQGSEIRVNTTTTDTQDSPDLAMDSAGNFAVVWESNLQDGSGSGIYGRLFNADGTAKTGELLVNTTTSGNQTSPAVAMDDGGNFVAAWVGFDANLTGVFAQRFDSTGTQQGSQFQVNQTVFDGQSGPAVAMDADGDFAISWHSNMQAPDFGGTAVMAREYLGGGGARGDEFIVNSTYGGSQLAPSVARADTGAIGIVWQGSGVGDADGVFLQRYQSPSVTFSVGGGTGDATMTFRGTIADINQALDGVTYTPNPGFNGTDTLTITTNDLGNTGAGGPLADIDTIDIGVGVTPNTAPTFAAGTGTVTTPIGTGADRSFATVVQPDGKVLVAGTTLNGPSYDFVIVRYNADGTLDTGFGTDGTVLTPVGTGTDEAHSIALQDDGKIVVAGYASSGDNDFAVVRYNTDGSLDTGFGTGGKVTTPIGSGDDYAHDVAVQADGKIVVSGYIRLSNFDFDFAVVRYNADGSLDSGFGTGGKVITAFGTSYDEAYSVAVQADGKIVVAGSATNGLEDFALVRYNSDGSLDLGFGTGGKVTTPIGAGTDTAYDVLVQSDGKLVVAGQASGTGYDFALARYNADGSLDTGFGSGGTVLSAVSANNDFGRFVALQSDDKIVVGGSSNHDDFDYDFALTRYNTDGSLDSSFGTGGTVFTQIGSANDYAMAGALTAGDEIVVAGYGNSGANDDIAVARYNADGSLDTSFGLAGGLDGTASYTEGAVPVVLDGSVDVHDAELDALNSGLGDYAGASLVLARNGGANAEDLFGFSDGNGITLSGSTLLKNSQVIASFDTTTPGQLTVVFTNANGETPASADVDSVLSQITYSNGSDAPPASVQIDWTFDDGNTGSQGTGGALQATGTTTVDITAVNDDPTNAGSLPSDLVFLKDTQGKLDLSAIDLSDVDAGSGDLTLTISSASGHLQTLGWPGLTLGGSQTVLTLTGNLTDLNDFLNDVNSIDYEHGTPGMSGDNVDLITIEITDNGNTGVGGGGTITLGTVNIDITPANQAPIVDLNGSDEAGTNYTVTFTEDGGAVAVTDADAIVSDADDIEFQYLGINLFNMPDGASEAIVVAGYTFSYGTGDVVTRTVGSTDFEIDFDATGFSIVENAGGNIPLADLQTLMRGITYENLSQNPTPGDRTIEFEAVDASGLVGPTATSTVSVNALNDAPVVTTTVGATSYTERAAATVIDSGVTVLDPDGFDGTNPSDQFVGVVRITGNYEAADILGFTDTGTIQGVLTGDQLVLSVIAGQTATVSEFEAALQSITFYNGSDTPSELDRTISFSFDDGVDSSNIATKVVRVTGVDDAPIVDLDADDSSGESGGDFATSWTEGLGPVAIADVDALLSDVDSPTLTSMNVRIINLLDGAFESLSADTTGTSINANYNTATGLLTLIGFDSVANYQQVLRTVVYDNTAASPDASARVVQFTATDGITPSNTATTTITIGANEVPVVTPSGLFVQYNENAAPVQVDPSVTVSDSDSATLAGATVRISGNYTSGEDVLSFADQLGISGSWDAGSGTLTLSGSATVGDYQTALRAVTYHNTSEAPNIAARTIEFIVSDGADSSTPATRSLSIVSWNDAPVTDDVSANGLEDAVSIPITLTGSDVDGTVDRFRLSTLPANGTLYTDAGLSTAAVTGVDYGATGESLTLHFVPDADWSGVTTFEYAARSADGGIDSSPATATITVNSVNDDPTNTGSLPTDVTVIEDSISPVDLASIDISDVDAANNLLTITLTTSTGGRLFASSDFDVTIFGSGTGVVTLTGGVADLNTFFDAPGRIQYLHGTPHTNGDDADTIQVDIRDNGNTGAGGGGTIILGTVNVDITPVNDAPVVDLDADNSSGETGGDFAATWTEGLGPVAIADADALLSDVDSPTLTSLTVSISSLMDGLDEILAADVTGTGISVTTNPGMLTLTGVDTVANYQQVLRTITYENTSEDPNTTGRIITFVASDGADASTLVRANVTMVATNDPPVNTVPIPQTTSEDVPLVFSVANGNTISISDVDATSGTVELTLSVANGTLTLADTTGLGFEAGADGTESFTVRGTLANLNIALDGLIYTPDPGFGGSDVLNVTSNDLGRTGTGGAQTDFDTVGITITPVNTVPVVTTSGGTTSYSEQAAPVAIDPGITVVDPDGRNDEDPSNAFTATVVISANFEGNDLLGFVDTANIRSTLVGNTLTLWVAGGETATVAEFQAALRTVTFYNGGDTPSELDRTVSFSFNDGIAASDLADKTVQVTATNDAPVIAANTGLTVPEEGTATITQAMLEVTDADNPAVEITYTVTTDSVHGTLRNNGIALGVGSSFTQADINAGVLTYQDTDIETTADAFSFTVSDGAGGSIGATTFSITVTPVNDAPVAVEQSFSLPENSADGTVVGTVSASDPDAGDTLSYAITGGDPAGAFSIDAATGEITVNDSAQLDFETTPVFNLTVTVTDAGGLTDTAAVTVNLTNVNEDPAAGDAAFSLAENSGDGTVVGSVSASDQDASDTLSYAITGGDPAGAFSIDAATGEITVNDSAQLDFETTPVFNLTVTVTDAGGLTDTAAVTVNLTNVNEDPAAGDAAFSLAENSADGTVVGSVSASDPDAGDTLSYAITGGDPLGAFAIDAATGQITVADSAQLDFETTPVFNLTVTVTDAGGLTDTAAVTVNLTNVNEDPAASDATFSLAENSADGTVVGSVSTSDPDAGDTLTYAITGGDPLGAFAIDAATGQITVADSAQLDFETSPVFNLTVTVTDAGGLTDTAAVTVNLTNVNEVPAAGDAAFSLAENSADGSVVGSVSASDPDAGDTLSYAITGGDPLGAFAIDAATGQITVADAGQLDFETTPVFNLTVTVTDAGGLTDTAAVTVNLTNVNEDPAASDATFSLAENSADGTVVGSVSTSDPDAGDTLTYAITGGDPLGAFAIDAATGQITVADSAQLDFETSPVFNLTVTVTDAGGLTDTAAVTVNLTNVNEVPAAGDAAFSLAENSADGSVVGSVSASDPDAGDTLSYAITGGDPLGAFAIDAATGQITVADAGQLDFETTPVFNLTVTVTDAGGLTDTAAVTVNLTNVNEDPAASDATFSLAENSADGTVVGSVSASDPDAGDTLSYAITGGDPLGAFAIDATTGEITVADAGQLDFETSPVFNLTVTVTDAGGLTDTAAVTINVTGDNEAPTASDAAFSLAENSADGTVVGSVSASDPDAGDTLSYAISGGDPLGAFAINATTGEITVADSAQLDLETTPVFNLMVTVTDAGGLTDTSAVTVNLTNVNEDPTASDATFALAENSADGTVVGSVSASDPDVGDTLSYAITGGDPLGTFAIDATTGEITVADSAQLDFETTPVFNLTVTVTDAGGLTDTAAVTVNLTNVNEDPAASDATFSLAENSADGTVVGSVSASDPDAGDTLSYAITGGDPSGAFSIDAATGQITVADSAQLDFETTPVFNLTVTVTDAGGLTDTAAVTVNLTNVNEDPAASDATFSLAENSADGTVVGSVSTSDPDAGDTLTYAITGGDPLGAFAIDAATGQITVADSAQLDFETSPVFNLTVTVTDAGGLTDTAAVTVNLTNVNEVPAAGDAAFSLAENSADGSVVGSVSASDPDAGDTLSYAITGGDPSGAFAIDAATGQITVTDSAQLDFETTPVFNLTVTVTDAGGLTDTAAVTVNLTNVNEDPAASDATFSLAENSADGTVVGSVSASDPDVGDTLTYAITGGDPLGAFAIDAATGQITVADSAQLDFETTPVFNLTVTVTDAGGLTDTAAVTVNLTNVNEDPAASDATFSLAENSADGTVVGSVSASDPDAGDTLSYAITGGDPSGAFSIDAVTGQITVADSAQLDFETTPVFSLTVTVTDAGGLTDTAAVTVNLTNVNEDPTASDATFSLAENSADGTVVGSVSASDPDAGDTLSYAITGGDPSGAFSIDAVTGQITVADSAQLDFETTSVFNLTVTVTDAGGLTDTAAVTVNLTNVNEDPAASDATFSLAENSADGTVVGSVSTSDPDAGDTLSYAITGGDPLGAFAIDAATGQITVTDSAQLDFETTPVFNLTVTVTDAGGLTDTAAVTINVTGDNEAPTASDATFALAENSADGTVVGSVSASDPDAGDTLSYAITGGDPSGAFAIDAATGQITVTDSAQLDFETTPVFNLTVTVTDAGGLTDTAAVTVNLTNVNEDPAASDATFSLAENSADGTVVGSVSASDPDVGDTLSYAITGGDPLGAFAIDAATGQITVADSAQLDFETTPVFNLTVTVTDAGGLTDTAAVTINVTGDNEAPTASDATFALAENSADGTVVGSVSASDPDAGDTLSYAITGGDPSGAFSIDAATGQITVTDSAQLDFETTPVFNLTVTVTDAGGLTDTAAVTVNLTNVNEDPAASDATFSLAENSADGTVVESVSASDPDVGDTLTYAITGGDPSGAFSIDAVTGQITVADSAQLDFETTPVFSLTVTVTDAGGLTDTAAVTINVTGDNEAPTASDATFALAENSADGTVVGSVSASDPDAGDTLSYAITGGDPSGAFAIDAATGQITVTDSAQLDFETTPVFNLTVTVTDAGGLTDTAAVTVNLTNVNEDPAASDATFSLAENSADGTVVGSVSASDPDVGDTLSYAITGGDPLGAFAIDAATGQITVADSAQLDFETTPVFNLTVTVTDAGGLTDTAAVTINVTGDNEAPTASDATFALAENSADGTVVGSVSASDPDAGDTLSYAITGGDPSGAFSIDAATGQITVTDSAQLDFETTPVFNLTVTVTDAGGLTDTAAVTVNLTNVNEDPAASDATFSLAENSADGTVVGSVSASDPDVGDTLSYAITGGDPLGAFAIDAATGQITVADSAQLDFETTPVFNLTVTVTDAGGLTDTAAVTVNLTNVNEDPAASDATFSLAENSADGTVVGSVSASDPDAGDTLSYAITGGDPSGAFSIDAATGQITVTDSAQLDFETTPVFNLTVTVTDAGGLTDTAAVTVNLTNVNEDPTASDAAFALAENSADGTVVGSVSASDPDAGDTLTYAITGGDPLGAFAINATTGEITVADSAQLDFETSPVFNLTLTVTDAGGLTDTSAVTVNLTNVNEDPAASDATFSLAENSADGTVVGSVSASDPDAGDTLSYAITGGDPSGAFSIDAATGQITVTDSAQLDFETTPVFNLTVTVTDAGGLTDTAAVTVNLTNVNEDPAASDATFSLAENSADGTVVGSVPASDPDVGDTLSYAITGGDPLGAFAIDAATGQITVADSAQLDFETTPVFNLTVTVTDAGGLTDTAAVTVNLTNVNEDPAASDATFSLAENSADGTVVGSVSASDPDAGDTLSYAITGGDPSGAFSIDAATGQITVTDSAQLDFETTPVFNLTVTVTDAGGLTDTAAVTVNLTNVNEDPTASDAAFALAENSADGTVVGSVSASDPDAGDTLTYAITGGDPLGAFAINATTGEITVADSAQLDFETSPVFNLTLTVTDAGGLTDTSAVTVNLTNVNEDPAASDATFSLAENSADGTVVGSVPASDPDVGDTLTYAITGGDPLGAFAIDAATGQITVADSAQLDFETTPVFNLTVTVTDAGGLTDTAAVTVNLTNVNEDPAASDATFSLAENSADGTVVGSVSASDPDAGDTLSYAITGGDPSGAFSIDAATGQITVTDSAQLDFETTPVFNLTVTVTDAGGLTDTAAVTVNLTNVNEDPTASDAAFALAENSADGTVVGSVSASDPDAGDTLTYAITGGDPLGAFAINATTGEITVADSAQLDFETTLVFNLTVTVTDAGGLTDTAAVTVNLTNVNEDPAASDATFSLAENSADGTVVGSVSASDPDAGDTLSYAITGGDPSGAFSIDAATGQITVTDSAQLDFETTPVFNLTVTVTDAGGLSDTAAVTVNLTNVNEDPTASDATFSLAENSADGTVVGSVSASDPDAGDTLSYAITGGDPSGAFSIDAVTGQITVADSAQLDFETTPVFSLTVTVTDAGGLTDTAAVTVNLTNVNEDPTASDATFSLAENSADGTVVGSVSASDPDAGDTLSYAITGGDPGGAFSIDAVTGEITVADSAQLDFETTSVFNLTVTVTDAGGLTDTAAVTVNLTNVNEDPAASDATFSLAENSADGTVVGSVSASDPDVGDTLTYAITGGDPGGAFSIDAVTGEITVADSAQLDFETTSVFNLTVTVTDVGGLTDSATVTVSLIDLNEAPTANDAAFSLVENSADGTVVGSVSASDPDAGGTLTYAITGGDPSGAFAIDATTGEITVADASQLDFETTPVFDLTVTVTDIRGLTDTAAVRVNLINLNEAPTASDAALSVAENSADGTVVGSVSASDPDAGDTLSYAITDGDPTGAFAIDAATGEITVNGSAQLDFETTPVSNLAVTVTDAGGLTNTAAVTVTLTGANEAPTATQAAFSVAENSADGTVVGSVSASDPDAGDTLSYAITDGDPTGVFAIDAATGEITVNDSAQLDFETSPIFNLRVTVTDAGGLTDTETVPISVQFVEDSPVIDDSELPPIDEEEDPAPTDESEETDSEPTREVGETDDEPAGDPAAEADAPAGEPRLGGSGQVTWNPIPLDSSEVAVPASQETSGSEELIHEVQRDPLAYTERAAAAEGRFAIVRNQQMIKALDQLRQEMTEDAELMAGERDAIVSTAEEVALAFSAGLLGILLRGSSLAAVALTALPVWRRVDPLAILALTDEERKRREEELRSARETEDSREEAVGRLLDAD